MLSPADLWQIISNVSYYRLHQILTWLHLCCTPAKIFTVGYYDNNSMSGSTRLFNSWYRYGRTLRLKNTLENNNNNNNRVSSGLASHRNPSEWILKILPLCLLNCQMEFLKVQSLAVLFQFNETCQRAPFELLMHKNSRTTLKISQKQQMWISSLYFLCESFRSQPRHLLHSHIDTQSVHGLAGMSVFAADALKSLRFGAAGR